MNVSVPHLLAAGPSAPTVAPSLEPTRLRLSIVLVVLDALALCAGFFLVGSAYIGEFPGNLVMRKVAIVAPLFLAFGAHNGFYKPQIIFSMRRTLFLCIYGFLLAAFLMLFITFYAKTTDEFSRVVFTLGSILAVGLVLAFRWVLRKWVERKIGSSLENVVIIHAGGPAVQMDHAYHVDAVKHGLSSDTNDPLNLDRLGSYMQNMDRVIVSCPYDDREHWTPVLRAAGVRGEFVSDALRRLGAIKIHHEPSFSSLVVSVNPLGPEARAIKRVMDLSLSSVALLVLSPLMVAVAILIALEDGGPVFFKQRRMGRGNRLFWIYKFRSMRAESSDQDGVRSTSWRDDRVTTIGRFIRKTSIDELPQLLNVWRGEMSLVGPRPHALGSQAGDKLFWEVDGRYWARHSLKPGLTGLAQIRGFRGETKCERDLTDRLQADLEYISNWSVFLDLKIIIGTLRVLMHEKAY